MKETQEMQWIKLCEASEGLCGEYNNTHDGSRGQFSSSMKALIAPCRNLAVSLENVDVVIRTMKAAAGVRVSIRPILFPHNPKNGFVAAYLRKGRGVSAVQLAAIMWSIRRTRDSHAMLLEHNTSLLCDKSWTSPQSFSLIPSRVHMIAHAYYCLNIRNQSIADTLSTTLLLHFQHNEPHLDILSLAAWCVSRIGYLTALFCTTLIRSLTETSHFITLLKRYPNGGIQLPSALYEGLTRGRYKDLKGVPREVQRIPRIQECFASLAVLAVRYLKEERERGVASLTQTSVAYWARRRGTEDEGDRVLTWGQLASTLQAFVGVSSVAPLLFDSIADIVLESVQTVQIPYTASVQLTWVFCKAEVTLQPSIAGKLCASFCSSLTAFYGKGRQTKSPILLQKILQIVSVFIEIGVMLVLEGEQIIITVINKERWGLGGDAARWELEEMGGVLTALSDLCEAHPGIVGSRFSSMLPYSVLCHTPHNHRLLCNVLETACSLPLPPFPIILQCLSCITTSPRYSSYATSTTLFSVLTEALLRSSGSTVPPEEIASICTDLMKRLIPQEMPSLEEEARLLYGLSGMQSLGDCGVEVKERQEGLEVALLGACMGGDEVPVRACEYVLLSQLCAVRANSVLVDAVSSYLALTFKGKHDVVSARFPYIISTAKELCHRMKDPSEERCKQSLLRCIGVLEKRLF